MLVLGQMSPICHRFWYQC